MDEEKALSKREKRALKKQKKAEEKEKRDGHVRLFPADENGYHVMPFLNFLRVLLYPLQFVFFPYRMYGNTKIGKGACLYIGNHLSFVDIFFPARTTKEGLHFICKESLTQKPVLRGWAKHIGAIPVKRDGTDIRPIMEALRILKNGEKVCIYPEGTRNKTGTEEVQPFRGGAAMLAIRARVPVVPVVVCNKPRLFRRTHVVIGEPFELSEYYDKKVTSELCAEADEFLHRRISEIRKDFLESRNKK